jgi:hypothetical protein
LQTSEGTVKRAPQHTRAESFLVRNNVRTRATRNHDEIRRWARAHGADPATGEASASGPATVQVTDGDAGVRFNFPGTAKYRPISWDEWFDHFERQHLVFVYDEEDTSIVARRAYARWQMRGGGDGRDWEDWFQAERELRDQAGSIRPPLRWRFLKDDDDAD